MFEVLFLEDAGVGGLATLVMGENTSKCLLSSVFHRFAWLGLCSSFTWVAGFSLAGAGGGAWPDLCLVV